MKRFIIFLLVLLMLPVCAGAEESPVEISTVDELLAITEDPSGSYILTEDLDMTGTEWPCPDFSGSFDGNGHAILNLTLSQPGKSRMDAYDGNARAYETAFAGLFTTLKDAQVQNLRLINLRGLIETDEPCFVGGIAGYMENSVIENCEITGTLELRAHDRMFGIGGAAGYGTGEVTGCRIDMALICVDTDAQTKDEQFLGGVYGSGFIQVTDCQVRLDGYISEHGYVHSGGITGMYMYYPLGNEQTGRIQNNRVEGKISFFEDNLDRRAYCGPFIGEILVFYAFFYDGNVQDFLRDERVDYTKELRPDMCGDPTYTATVTPPGCDSFGFTTFCCETCGYTYTDSYTLPQHTLTQWTVTKDPTEEAEGLSESVCDLCGEKFQKVLEKLPPQPAQTDPPATQAPATEPAPAPAEPEEQESPPLVLTITLCAAALIVILLCVVLKRPKQKGKFQSE